MTNPKFKVLGDPHLGRSFIHGVPLHRRGEREEMVWKQFREELKVTDQDIEMHINMGDLFDKSVVSYDVIDRAAQLYRAAAAEAGWCKFVIMKGNHDLMRDLERLSAFDLFTQLVSNVPNIKVVTEPTILNGYLFVPYDPITPTAELVAKHDYSACTIAFGHWDTNGFGTEHNVVPTAVLSTQGIKTAITGHVHKPEVFDRHNVRVIVVGSMQPYAFGEQADDTFYVEHTLASLKTAGDLHDKVVRVSLEAGEMLDEEVDCLQLIVRRMSADVDDAPVVTMGDFNMETLFRQACTSAGVSEKLTETLIGKYNDQRLLTAS